ncbi:radical SAM protein [Candidatus Dependentiae bacterium]|nr:radical SAM protein [Candidatus Dependentiae bacterium]
MNIVIANSVGIDKNGYYIVHSPSRWSLGVKNFTDCIYYPWELAYTTSLLKHNFPNHNIAMVDGILNRQDSANYFKTISALKPDILIMEPSARTYAEDSILCKKIKNVFNSKIIFCGGLAAGAPEILKQTADYVCPGEYENSVLNLISSNFNIEHIKGVYPNGHNDLLDIDALPFPEDEDISRIKYFEPNCEYKEIQFYTSRGCPMKCSFCVCGNLYYNKPNWRCRKSESIISEIKYLGNKYSEMEGLFFDEEVHNVRPAAVINLCKSIILEKLNNLKIDAMCEYYPLNEEVMDYMKEAGYYKLRIGIETASPIIAEKMNLKNKFNIPKLYEVLDYSKKIGLKMYGTFTIGGLGSTKDEDNKTVKLIYDLISNNLLNDIQVSINTPQPGTPFFKEVKEKKYLITEDWLSFDGGKGSVVSYPDYSKTEIDATFKSALDKYDEGLKIRAQNYGFDKNIKKKLNSILQCSDKILLIRSYRMWLVEIIIESLNKNLSKSIILQEEAAKYIKNHEFYRKYFYGNGFIKKECFSLAMINEINTEQYDFVIIPVRNIRINNYYNVIELLNCFNIKNKILVDSFGEIRYL